MLRGDATAGRDLDDVADVCDRAGQLWLAHLARAALVIARPEALCDATAVRQRCLRLGDRLGAALVGLVIGVSGLAAGRSRVDTLDDAGDVFRQTGLRILELWTQSVRALSAEMPDHGVSNISESDESPPRTLSSDKISTVLRALMPRDGSGRHARSYADTVPQDPSVKAITRMASPNGGRPTGTGRVAAGTTLRVLGGFALELPDTALNVTKLKPRARAVLHVLAVHAGDAVHRESIMQALWPDRAPEAALRAMHVSLSSIRRQLEQFDPEHAGTLLQRHGSAYVLGSGAHVHVDRVEFERACIIGQAAARDGDTATAVAELSRALALYRGDLLPEAGPAEWIIEPRRRLRAAAADIAERLADTLLESDDLDGAVEACERGLAIDGLHDGLWKIVTTAHERRGYPAVAERVRRSYDRMLRDLGVLAVAQHVAASLPRVTGERTVRPAARCSRCSRNSGWSPTPAVATLTDRALTGAAAQKYSGSTDTVIWSTRWAIGVGTVSSRPTGSGPNSSAAAGRDTVHARPKPVGWHVAPCAASQRRTSSTR